MANMTEKNPFNASIKEYSSLSTHMGVKIMNMEELKVRLLQRGCYMTDNIEDLKAFIRKRYPALTNMEVDDLIKRNAVWCKL